jgi:hypothetical protein
MDNLILDLLLVVFKPILELILHVGCEAINFQLVGHVNHPPVTALQDLLFCELSSHYVWVEAFVYCLSESQSHHLVFKLADACLGGGT